MVPAPASHYVLPSHDIFLLQVIEMHKEKVSRREIGMLTVSKTFPPYQKVIYPKNIEPLQPYYRKPLDFSTLDDIGHGIKVRKGHSPIKK